MARSTHISDIEVSEDLDRLDVGIRRLKVQYDMFFAGGLKAPPIEFRSQLERIIRRYSRTPIRKYADRFRYNALVSRFNLFSERWGKTIRALEEGGHRNPGSPEPQGVREHLVTRCVIGGAEGNDDELRRMHSLYLEASREHGKRGASFESFVRGVTAQADRLRKSVGCGQIELRLVVRNDKVQLKARPGR